MISRFKYYFITLLLPILFSCESSDLQETTRVVNLSSFDAIELNDVFDVYLIQDETYSVQILGFGDAPGQISLLIKNDTLSITNHARNKWLNPQSSKLKLYIHSNRLREITAHATCYFETINPIISEHFSLIMGSETKLMEGKLVLSCNSFWYWNSHLCGGKLTVSGNVNYMDISTFSTASVDARNLIAKQASIQNNSKGFIEVFVNNRLDYSIRGTGNIYLYGNPTEVVLGEKTASGKLILR